jgi:hypothetical protein
MTLVKSKEQLIHIPLYYVEKDIRGYSKAIVINDETAEKMKADEKLKERLNVLNTYWSVLNWQENNAITKASTTKNEETTYGKEVDQLRLQDLKIKTCLKKWDLKDEDGKDLPVTPENINRLESDIIYALIYKYSVETQLVDDEIKNL